MTAQDLGLVANEIRVAALRLALAEAEFSPVDLHRSGVGGTLGAVAYHVRVLRDAGLIRPSRTQGRRGATEHYYRLEDSRKRDVTKLLTAVAILEET